MSVHPCFASLERACSAFRLGRQREALAMAEAAFQLTKEIPGAPPQAGLVASWYGFLLATEGGAFRDGLELCRQAAEQVFWEPKAFEHVARLELVSGSRVAALHAARRGLELSPNDDCLLSIRRELGVRQRPPLPFLGRSNPINRWVGQALARGRS